MALVGGYSIIDQESIELTGKPKAAFESLPKDGATYKPLRYLGTKVTKGLNYGFIAQETIFGSPIETHIVFLSVNEFDGKFTPVLSEFHRIL